MEHDPAVLGSAAILFGIAVMIFGLTTGNTGIAGGAGILGLVIALIGFVHAMGRGPGKVS